MLRLAVVTVVLQTLGLKPLREPRGTVIIRPPRDLTIALSCLRPRGDIRPRTAQSVIAVIADLFRPPGGLRYNGDNGRRPATNRRPRALV